ncbi:uncharacterized protein LOC118757024 [Rhagoletis pomonella]|uniref:uncharacterized protein LOC118757024 n=1 Tax=Rhagoletis pomonella TaxID=28610 RepID=UPI001784535E|nr:uncharacterized protein LOC118757024 [Rhagoletis pomonella]
MYRVAEILENTNLQQWRWVPSRLNPADLATKQESKVDSDTWINGPHFLKADENDWPNRKDFGPIDDSVEIRHHVLHIHIAKQQLVVMNTEYFSSWRRLYRAVATFILYKKTLQAKVHSLSPPGKVNFEMIEMAKAFLMSKRSSANSCKI